MEYILAAIIITLLLLQEFRQRQVNKRNMGLVIENTKHLDQLKELQTELINLQDELGGEREKNRALLSQKKSSETRLGQISEHLVPFLENCKHDPKTMHFLGNPIDYVVFDFDDGKITFLEVKSGNSKPSKRQKVIKNIIKAGRVHYEEIRINERGIRNKVVKGEELPFNRTDNGESNGEN
jgi:predicted Holliday junction resolvase-like endonuclease